MAEEQIGAREGSAVAGSVSGHLVADVRDHIPFAATWSELDIADVERFLLDTTEDEPLHWEAKGDAVTADHVRRAVTAFSNREGGYLIIGARRDPGSRTWALPGVKLPEVEPRTWLSKIIRMSISPPPEFDIRAWDRPGGMKAAVVMVQPNCGFLSLTGGKIYYRRPGESSSIENGAELQAVHSTVQYRSRALPGGAAPPQARLDQPTSAAPEALDPGMDAAAAISILRRCLASGRDKEVSVYLAAATNQVVEAFSAGDESTLASSLMRIRLAQAARLSAVIAA
jgi:hypothetical protein